MKIRQRLSRLPLRVRLVAGFSLTLLVVLLAAGAFVYWRVEYALDRGLDTQLSQAADTITPLVAADGTVQKSQEAAATGVSWQVLGSDGAVLSHGGVAGSTSLLHPRALEHVSSTPRTYDVGDFLPADEDPYRLRVQRISAGHFLLVGVERNHRDEALRELLAQLSIAGLAVLLVTAYVGDRLARAALRPVERYRRRATDIAGGEHGLRLDVPERRDDEITRLGHTFNDMLGSLEGSLQRERQFVAEASHELRTPITLLTSRIQLALRRPRSVDEHERILTELKVDLDRLAALSEQLLQVSRADAANAAGSGDLVHVVGRSVSARRVADPEHAGDISVTLPDAPLVVALADYECERIVANLLTNAAAHGTPPVTVMVDEPSKGWARLVVSDAGEGMSPELLASATARFTRADEARARPGSGLGLSLVDGLVTRAGGELRLCFGGTHTSTGTPAPVTCEHSLEMTVTVLLPLA